MKRRKRDLNGATICHEYFCSNEPNIVVGVLKLLSSAETKSTNKIARPGIRLRSPQAARQNVTLQNVTRVNDTILLMA